MNGRYVGISKSRHIKMTKVKLFDFSIFDFYFIFMIGKYSNPRNTYMIIYHQIRNFWNFDIIKNCQILKIF